MTGRAGEPTDDEESRRARVSSLDGGDEALAQLMSALGDESWRVRKDAAARAASWPAPERAIASLLEALAEPENVGRRNSAVEALVLLGARAVPALLDGLAERPEHRKLHVDALGLIGDRRAVPALAGALADADANVRAAAAEALGRVGGVEASAALLAAMERGELLLSVACLDALSRQGVALPVSRLAPLVAVAVLKPGALAALGHSRDPAAAPILAAQLADRSRAVRETAATALARLHSLVDESGRAAVASTLASMSEEAEQLLTLALLEGGAALRPAAAAVLGLSGRPSAVRPLALALGDADVQEAAVTALLRIGPPGAGELALAAANLDGTLRAEVFRILPDLVVPGDATAPWRTLLHDSLLDEDDHVAVAAARAIGELDDAAAIDPLLATLAAAVSPHGRPELARAAARALGRLATRLPDAVRAKCVARGFAGAEAAWLCLVLASCGKPDDAPLLLGLVLHDQRAAVRAAAAEALAAVVTAPGIAARSERSTSVASIEETLCLALVDEAAEVRAAAARALARFPSARVAAALHGAGADGDPAVRLAAVKALAAQLQPRDPARGAPELSTISASPALSALVALIASAHPPVAVLAIDALGRSGHLHPDSHGAAALVAALRRDDAETVKSAVHALAQIAARADLAAPATVAPGAIESALVAALAHPRWDVRSAAATALGPRAAQSVLASPRVAIALRARLAVETDALVRGVLTSALAAAAPVEDTHSPPGARGG